MENKFKRIKEILSIEIKMPNKIKEIFGKLIKIPIKIIKLFIRFFKWIKLHIYGILYIGLVLILSKYIISNWDKCISMKFFEQFDGNNILFLVWIASFIAFFYDVEAKGFKFQRRKYENMDSQYKNAENRFNNIQASTSPVQVTNNKNEEENGDE